MKEVSFHASVPGCSTHDFYQFACSEPTALEQFHREVNKDDTVEVYWVDQDKSARMCTYTLATPIPSALQSFVGAGPIRVKEKQVFTWLDENTLKIASRPMVQITYGRALRTDAEMLLSPTPEGCYMEVKVKVTAALPWAMQYLASTIEALMAAEAKRTNSTKPNVSPGLSSYEGRSGALLNVVVGLDLAMSERSGGSEPGAEVPSSGELDVFYDASELGRAEVLEVLMKELQRELRAAKEQRQEANRLLSDIKGSIQRVEQTISKEVAFQEGVRFAQRSSNNTLLLSVASTALVVSAATALIFMRRNSSK
eukprot:gene12489-12623_t